MRYLLFLLILLISCKKDRPFEIIEDEPDALFIENFQEKGKWELSDELCYLWDSSGTITSNASISNGILSLSANQEEPCCVASSALLSDFDELTETPCKVIFTMNIPQSYSSALGTAQFKLNYNGYHLLVYPWQPGLYQYEMTNNKMIGYLNHELYVESETYTNGYYIDNNLETSININMSACGADNWHFGNITIDSIAIESFGKESLCSIEKACVCEERESEYWLQESHNILNSLAETILFGDSLGNNTAFTLTRKLLDTTTTTFSYVCYDCAVDGRWTKSSEYFLKEYNSTKLGKLHIHSSTNFNYLNDEYTESIFINQFSAGKRSIYISNNEQPDFISMTRNGKTFTNLYRGKHYLNDNEVYFNKEKGLCIMKIDDVYWTLK